MEKKLPYAVIAAAGVAVVVGDEVVVGIGIGVAVVVVGIICEGVVVDGTADVVVGVAYVAVFAVVSRIRAKNHTYASKKLNTIKETIFF